MGNEGVDGEGEGISKPTGSMPVAENNIDDGNQSSVVGASVNDVPDIYVTKLSYLIQISRTSAAKHVSIPVARNGCKRPVPADGRTTKRSLEANPDGGHS